MKNLFCLAWIVIFSLTAFAADQTPQSNWAKFGDSKIHYYDIGDKKRKDAVVFVHGWTCSADFWRSSFAAFPTARVVAIDLIGHGRSDKPKADYTMEYFAKSVAAALADAKIERAVLVGHSMGTPVVRQFYRLHPEKTAALVIVDGALRPMASREQTEAFMKMLRADYKKYAVPMVDGMLQPVKDEKLKTEIKTAMLATPDYVAVSAMTGMADEKNYANDEINVPVLTILAKSPFWQPDTETFLRSLAPALEFQMWENVSHFLMMEKPIEFNRALQTFLDKNKLMKK